MLAVLAGALMFLELWFRTFVVGAYYAHAPLYLTVLGIAFPVLVVFVAYLAGKKVYNYEV